MSLSSFLSVDLVVLFFSFLRLFEPLILRNFHYAKTTLNVSFFKKPAEIIVDLFLIIIPFCAFFWSIPKISFRPNPVLNQPSPTAYNLPNNINPPPLPVRPRLRLPPVIRRLIQICFLASLLTTSTAIAMMVILLKTLFSTSQEIQSRVGYMAFVLSHLTVSQPFII